MDKLRSLTVAAAVAFALAACAQNETAPDDTTASTSGSTSTSTSTTAEGATSPDSSSSTGSASYPDSSSSSSSSTTASTTPDSATPDSSSSTGSMESNTGTMSQSGADASATADASTGAVAIGLQVESETGEPLGTVTNLVADPTTGAPMFVVISTEGETTAMPHSAASSMVQGDALVIERTRLASAPRVEQNELNEPTADWTSEANDYWGRGEMRTASPETDTSSDSTSSEQPMPEGEPRG